MQLQKVRISVKEEAMRPKKHLDSDLPMDKEQFVQAVLQKKAMLYRIAFTYVKNKDDALEIVQEATYKAYISLKSLKKPQYFDTWLIRIVIYCALDYIRKRRKEVFFHEMKITNESNPEDKTVDLYAAMNQLNEKQKTVLILRFFEDKKIEDIAKILDCPISTVKSTLYRALEKLKIKLEEV
jgi:RNA polymerase sigma-70 factor (ECF subfamily)